MKILMWMAGNFDRRTPSEHLLVAIVQALYTEGHTVHIIQKSTGGPLPKLPKRLVELGVTTDCVPCQLASKGNFVARYLVELQYVWKCRKLIKKYRNYEAIFNQSSTVAGFMVFVAKHIMPKARLTYNIQDIFPENAAYIGSIKGIIYRILSVEQQYAYRHADQLITISEDMRELLIEKGADPKKIQVIYNWSYSDNPYCYEEVYSKKIAEYLPMNTFNVVYAGNIGTMQNVDIVVATAKLMQNESDIHFHIFGDGIYKERLQRKAERINNVSFWPMQPSDLAPSIYSMADVNIIPLAPNIYRTALPSKTATCIACQKPIIFCFGTESLFLKSIQEIGCFFECNTPLEIQKAILEIKNKKKNVKVVANFSPFSRTKNSKEYAQIIIGVKNENCSCL